MSLMKTFTEYTFTNSETEFMAHLSGNKWVRVYFYKDDIPELARKTSESKNPLFRDLVSPTPSTFMSRAQSDDWGFICTELDDTLITK